MALLNDAVSAIALLTLLLLLIWVNVMAFWRQDMILFIVSGIITILIGVQWIDDYAGVSIALWGLGIYQLLKAVLLALVSEQPTRGWSQFRGIYARMRGR